jgi:hypothetical protein
MSTELKKAKFDVPVLLIFFTRPDTFSKVFEAVRKARPSKLFLACDGPRDNRPDDIAKIEECKKIASNIDWECSVYYDYAEKNMGCGMRPQTAIENAFKEVDRLIVLEDDCVPHDSFFPYMAEMLERYKNDTRIGLISGFNHFENWDCGEYSYFYTKVGPMGGAWASWKRVWDEYSYNVTAINNPHIERLMEGSVTLKRAKKAKIKLWKDTAKLLENNENISYWDVQFGFLKFYMSYLTIVPKFSLVSNIGLGDGSTHAVNATNTMPSIFFAKDRGLEFPLNHPPFIICDHEYDDKVDGTWGFPNPVVRQFGRVKRLIKRMFKRG